MLTALSALWSKYVARDRHEWRDCAWNLHGIAAERKCYCGSYQHRQLNFPQDNGPWVNGEHPRAAELRAAGEPDRYPWDEKP